MSKIIPYHLKGKFMEEFDIANSERLPHITKIEEFLNENVK